MIGYSVVYLLEERNSISNQGENHWIEKSTISKNIIIKVPVSVPYQTNWDAPEPVEGQIEHEGQFYKMVTQQLINDTLYVHCEFDQNARDQFMDLALKINDQVNGNDSESQKQSHATILKSFLKEYMATSGKHVFYILEWSPSVSYEQIYNAMLSEACLSIPSPPPNLA